MPSELLQALRNAIRVRHYSIRTEKTYVDWVRRYIRFNGLQHPSDLSESDVSRFLTWLATERDVAASTQNQALNALVFLYANVLHKPLDRLGADIVRAKRPANLPTVFTEQEVMHVLAELADSYWLMTALLYGSGLRLMECVRLRIKDIEFDYRCLIVRDGKGQKDRVVTLSDALIEELRSQIQRVKILHTRDLAAGFGSVWLRIGKITCLFPTCLKHAQRFSNGQ